MNETIREFDEEGIRILEWHQLKVLRAKAPIRDRNAWIATARRLFNPGEREECLVCGKFKAITEAHHLIPLEDQYDHGFRVPNQEFAWLCPSHHETVHVFIQGKDRKTLLFGESLSDGEFEIVMKLVREAYRSEAI